MRITIFPLEKVELDGVSLHLGMTRSDAEQIVGKGLFVRDRYYYYSNELAISFNDNDRVSFIEFLGGIDGQLKPIIYGVSVFDANADDVYDLLKQHNGSSILDSERRHCYTFLNISVGVYRESTPESLTEMIKEAASFGNSLSPEEIEHETIKACHWATIGFGTEGYYQNKK